MAGQSQSGVLLLGVIVGCGLLLMLQSFSGGGTGAKPTEVLSNAAPQTTTAQSPIPNPEEHSDARQRLTMSKDVAPPPTKAEVDEPIVKLAEENKNVDDATTKKNTGADDPLPPPPPPGGAPALKAGRVAADGSSERPPYHEYWMGALHRELGPLISKAIYDPQMFVEAVKNPEYLWGIPFHKGMSHELTQLPEGLRTHGHQLIFMKRTMSCGLGRMHRDAGMELTYKQIETDAEFALFDRAVRHFIGADARHFFFFMQMMIDSMPGQMKVNFADFADGRAEFLGGSDPMWHVASLIGKDTTPDEINQVMGNIKEERLPFGQFVHRAERVLSPAYRNIPFANQPPRDQKYFSLIRPSGSCHTIQRECEHPDGCRFICNLEYLQSKLQDGEPFGHRFLGVGSNNEYDWETSLLKMFGMTPSHKTTNTIHSITEFDCTLRSGFHPPGALMTLPVGFGAAEICVGTQTQGKYMAFADLKRAVLDSELEGQHYVRQDIAQHSLPIKRHKMGTAAGVPGSSFDSVSIFKCDIEGWEFALLPGWSRSEYQGLSANEALRVRLQDGRTFGMVDFIKEIEFFSVSQFLLEVHASGYGLNSVWHMGHTLMQLHQMGFMMVANEKNFYGNCCYETVWVHYRFFVRSEMYVRSHTAEEERKLNEAAALVRARTRAPTE